MLLNEAATSSVAETQRLVAAAKLKSITLTTGRSEGLVTFLSQAVERIVVGESSLEIKINVLQLVHLLQGRPQSRSPKSDAAELSRGEAACIALSCNLRPRRRGREARLVVETDQRVAARPSLPLIKAVARANSWLEKLLSGEVSSLEGLVSETGFTKRYVSRTLRSAFLAPDITEMILDGRQSPDLTVRRLMAGFPADWSLQKSDAKA